MNAHPTSSRFVSLALLGVVLALGACQSTTSSDIGSDVRHTRQAGVGGLLENATQEESDGDTGVETADSTSSRSPVYIGSGH